MAGTSAGAIRAEQRQCQSLMRMRKGVSQQQEHVNGVNANQSQRSDEVKYGRQIWRGMQRGAHVCQRSDTKWDRQTDLTGHAERHVCLSEKRRIEKRQTDWTGHTEGCTCLSAEWRSEIRQTNWTGHAEGHTRLSEEQATCREWCASSQFIIVESFLF